MLLESIHDLYGLSNSQTFMRDVLLLLERLVPVDAAIVIVHPKLGAADWVALLDPQVPSKELYALMAQQVSLLVDNVVFYSLSPDFARLMEDLLPLLERYVLDSAFTGNTRLMPAGAHQLSVFSIRESWYDKALFTYLLTKVPFADHMMLLINDSEAHALLDDDQDCGCLYFYRNWDEWTERDRIILDWLKPHITQAYQSVITFSRLNQQVAQWQEMFDYAGVILLNEQGYIQRMSAQAASWLMDYCPTFMASRQLPEPLHTWFLSQILTLNRQVNVLSLNQSPSTPLSIRQENRQLTIHCNANLEKRQYIMLLTEEQTTSLRLAFQRLGLTTREAEVLFWVSQGQDNKAIALQMAINVSTVRKHLENIYQKLQVSSRTAAVTRSLEQIRIMDQPD
jgi:DNA-binding CsgD family transcriptional regulator